MWTMKQLTAWDKTRLPGAGLPEKGVMSLQQEDAIRRTQGDAALIAYEPDAQKIRNADASTRVRYEQLTGRTGFTNSYERAQAAQQSDPALGSLSFPDWGYNNYIQSMRKQDYTHFMGGDPSAGIPRGSANGSTLDTVYPIGVRQTKNVAASTNTQQAGTDTAHPLSGQPAGKYRIGDTIVNWDGKQEI